MTHDFAEYAVRADSAEEVASRLKQLLGLLFVPHDSEYWGDYLLSGRPHAGDHVKIYLNEDPMWQRGDPDEEKLFKPDHPDHHVLVEVWLESGRVDQVHGALQSAFADTQELSREPLPVQQAVQGDGPAFGGPAP